MLVKYENWRGKQEEDLNDFLNERLDGSDYERGELETIKETQELLKYSFVNLISTLVLNKKLSLNEVKDIVDYNGILEFVE